MSDKKIRVAIVGLGFGAEFIPIYQRHPNAEMYAICRRHQGELDACGDRFGIKTRYTSYEEMLRDPNIDAVHINSPIADHAPQSIAALKAGKHVASTVPAATTIDECRQIVELQRRSGKVYMMMETVVYSREYLFVKELYDQRRARADSVPARQPPAGHGGLAGVLGRLPADALRDALREPVPGAARQARRARGLPRIGPHRGTAHPEVRQSVRDRDRDVQAARLGRLRGSHAQPVRHRAPVPRELRRVRIEEVVRVAAGGRRRAGDSHAQHARRIRCTEAEIPVARAACPTTRSCCPSRFSASRSRRRFRTPSISRFCRAAATADRIRTWSTTSCCACLGEQPAMPDAETSVNWTMVGICAHQSALKNGEKIQIPTF